ncbi:MAG TPA: ankyrin repeat domain-containing protein [Kiritimatiellia bacterium]|nr:ankyrin repeat domain-containing protein [Kiritimatiellia bacterium]
MIIITGCVTRQTPLEPARTSLGVDSRDGTEIEAALHCLLNRDLRKFKRLVPTRAEADIRLLHGLTYLHYAVDTDQENFVEYLAGLGVSLNARDYHYQWTPLHIAVRREHPNMVRKLLARGANPSLADRHGWMPLHHAASLVSEPVLSALIEGGVPLEEACSGRWQGYRALHIAASHGFVNNAKVLLDGGADIHAITTELEETSLLIAARRNHAPMVMFLLSRGADVTDVNPRARSALHLAVSSEDPAIIESLLSYKANLEARDKHGETPLLTAVRLGKLGSISLLLDRGADMDARGREGETAVAIAAENGHADIIRFLAARGADIDAGDDIGRTPLIGAAARNHLEAVHSLIELGADVQRRTKNSHDALYYSILKASPDIIDLLIQHGANATNTYGVIKWTALHSAAWDNRIDLVDTLLKHGADIEAGEISGQRPLILAARRQHEEMIAKLLEAGADPYGASVQGLTAWHYAKMAGLENSIQRIEEAGGPPPESLELVRVYFELYQPEAKEVLLAGQFNNWGSQRIPLEKKDDGSWYVEVDVFNTNYGYKFIVDGQWITDPENPKTWTDRGYGSVNSSLIPSERLVENYISRDQRSPSAIKVITFHYTNSAARRVHLAGEFNGWNTSSLPLTKNDQGIWTREVRLSPGEYGYKFIVDNDWIADPANELTKEVAGAINSLIRIPEDI